MMDTDRYLLIVSQMYHERHCFIVRIGPLLDDEALHKRLIAMVEELLQLKRLEGWARQDSYLGDIGPEYWKGFIASRQYNLNDCGDIYIVCGEKLQPLMEEVVYYKEQENRDRPHFKRKAVRQALEEHHRYADVERIIERHFSLA